MSAQCLAQSLALGEAQWTNSVNRGHYYQQACCPAPFPFQLQKASQRAINAATRWLPSSHAGRISEGFEKKSSVQENNQIPIKPNYLYCLLIALLLRLSPSNKWGSDLRYGSGKGGLVCISVGGISCIMHPGIQRGSGWLPALSVPLFLPSLPIKAFIMIRVPFIAQMNKIWQNCK